MTKRIVLAGILGGLAMFVWMSIAHLLLPLGMVGVSEITNEQPVLAAMQASMGQTPGLYVFPGMGIPPGASRADQNAAMERRNQKLATSPSGLLVYHPAGAKALTPGQLGTEFAVEILEAMLAAFLLSKTRIAGFAGRVGFV